VKFTDLRNDMTRHGMAWHGLANAAFKKKKKRRRGKEKKK